MQTVQNCALNTIHYGGNIHHFFEIFGYLLFFHKYMKNKIGILENDIYIFPIVNSVNLLVHSLPGLLAYHRLFFTYTRRRKKLVF